MNNEKETINNNESISNNTINNTVPNQSDQSQKMEKTTINDNVQIANNSVDDNIAHNQVNQSQLGETINNNVISSTPVESNKKIKLKIIIFLIILLILLSLIGYFVYAKYILKEEPFIINPQNKIDTPIDSNDINKDNNNDEDEYDYEDEYDEENKNYVSISYFSIDDYKKNNLMEITAESNTEENMFFINKDKKICYLDYDSSDNSKPIALTDKNNKDIKLLFYDEMSDVIILALNESGQLFISDTDSNGKTNIKFNLAFKDMKFTKMYQFGYPSSTECNSGMFIVLESNNKKYLLKNMYSKNKYSLLELTDNYLDDLETSQPYCSGDDTFGIKMNMHGDLTYFVIDENGYNKIDKNKKDLINIETGTKIVGSKLITLKNSINISEDVSYIIDINNNLFEVRKYQDSYKKVGIVKSVTLKEEEIGWPEKITIELTDNTKIVIE